MLLLCILMIVSRCFSTVSSSNIEHFILSTFCSPPISSRSIKGHGAYVTWDGEFDEPGNASLYRVKPGHVYDCNVTYNIDSEGFSGLALMSSIAFSNAFKVHGAGELGTQVSEFDCRNAFLQIYDPPNALEPVYTYCSSEDEPSDYESNSPALMLRLYVNFNDTYNHTNADNVTTLKLPDALNQPKIYFKIHFTTFADDCDTSIFTSLMKCDHSKRCLHDDVVCDRFASLNCLSPKARVDVTDQWPGPPAYCGTLDDELLPLWIVLGILGGVLLAGLLYWLFWRPGWCPWRCSRLRNCKPCGKCCRRGGCSRLCSEKCCNCCRSGPGNSYSNGGSGPGGEGGGKANISNGYASVKPGGGAWAQFCAGDGFHLSEARY